MRVEPYREAQEGVSLWRIPEDSRDGVPDAISRTELIVLASSREEAIERAKAFMAAHLAPYPDSKDWHLYDQTEKIEGAVYDVPMYGYSW